MTAKRFLTGFCSRATRQFLFLFSILLLTSQASFALPSDFFELIEQPLAKYLYWRTPLRFQVTEMIAARNGVSIDKVKYQDFVEFMNQPENMILRAQSASLVLKLKSDMHTLSLRDNDHKDLANFGWHLTEEQKEFVRLYGAKFRINAAFKVPARRIKNMDPSQGRIQFVPEESVSAEAQAKAKLFFEEKPVDITDGELKFLSRTEWDALRSIKEAKTFKQRMAACVKGMPEHASRNQELRHRIFKLTMAEANTLIGSVSAAGQKVMTWEGIQQFLPTLAFDMMMTGYFSVKTSKSSDGRAPFMVRWTKTVFTREQRAVVDAMVFQVFPWKRPGDGNFETTAKRFSFNAMWAAGTAVIPVTLYSFISGMECLNQYAPMNAISKGIQMGESTATSVVYYNWRNGYMNNEWVSGVAHDWIGDK